MKIKTKKELKTELNKLEKESPNFDFGFQDYNRVYRIKELKHFIANYETYSKALSFYKKNGSIVGIINKFYVTGKQVLLFKDLVMK